MYNPQLTTFLAVADGGSFTKAADALFITPTAVMKQIPFENTPINSVEILKNLGKHIDIVAVVAAFLKKPLKTLRTWRALTDSAEKAER